MFFDNQFADEPYSQFVPVEDTVLAVGIEERGAYDVLIGMDVLEQFDLHFPRGPNAVFRLTSP